MRMSPFVDGDRRLRFGLFDGQAAHPSTCTGTRSSRAAHGNAHARLLDRHLADAGLLDDAHELADALRARLVDAAGGE